MHHTDSLFKPARSRNAQWNLIKTLLQTSVFWLVFLYLLPQFIVYLEEAWAITTFQALTIPGWSLFFLFSVLGISSGITMSWYGKGTPLPTDCPNKLVIRGPYKVVRNPMAVAGIGQGISVGLILGSFLVIAYALAGAFLWHVLVRPIEEQDLTERFGKEYLQYKAKIKCWIPTFKKLDN